MADNNKLKTVLEMLAGKKATLKNPDGSESSELTQTINFGKDRFTNVPTIDPERGMSIDTREGIKLERSRGNGAIDTFPSVGSAVEAAKKRSRAGGRDR